MAETVTNYRRIDRLKALAIEQGFTNEDAKQFGKLSKTATWEALLETYSISLHPVDTVDKSVDKRFNRLTQVIGLTILPFRSAISLLRTQPIF
jgi:hypothetical protein